MSEFTVIVHGGENEVPLQVGRRRNKQRKWRRAERKPGERHHRTECVLKEEGQ